MASFAQSAAFSGARPPRVATKALHGDSAAGKSSSWFLLGSVFAHAAFLWGFAHAPAHRDLVTAAPVLEVDFEIAPQNSVAKTPEPLPLGQLDNDPRAESPPPASTAKLAEKPVAAPLPPAEPAPRLMTSDDDNPYANADATVFTTGTGSPRAAARQVRVVAASKSAVTHAAYGVENGSENASEESKELLRAWHDKAGSELSRIAASNYPRRAQVLGQEGTVKIRVRVAASGHIVQATVATGSGHPILDRNALSQVQSVGKVSPPPAGVGSSQLVFVVPIAYRLR